MKKRIAINGFGRIGRMIARIILDTDDVELVAINDPSDPKVTAHLFQFDSNYGKFNKEVSLTKDNKILQIGDKEIVNFTSRNISDLAWGDHNVDIVIESTGVFRTKEACQQHIDQGAKKVLLSAPAKSEGFRTIVLGVNDEELRDEDVFVSNASCTTNCLAPVVKVLDDIFGITEGLMTTIHSYTNDQRVLDVNHKDLRRSRSAGVNMIPTTTGAAKSVGIVLPHLQGKLNGISVRIPTPTVSLVDFVFRSEKKMTAKSINQAIQSASQKTPHILGFEERPLVSRDFLGDSRSSIVDASETMTVSENFAKILSWYDNEWGYASRLLDMIRKM